MEAGCFFGDALAAYPALKTSRMESKKPSHEGWA